MEPLFELSLVSSVASVASSVIFDENEVSGGGFVPDVCIDDPLAGLSELLVRFEESESEGKR